MGMGYKQNDDFIASIISQDLLDDAISWISNNLSPVDVFDESELQEWAENAGYVKDD